VRDLPDGALFRLGDDLWQKVADNDICLSELDDQSWARPLFKVEDVEVAEVVRQEPWTPYQPRRNREKEFYDIKLRDGTVIGCCWPNGTHWHPTNGVPKKAGKGPIADYRVIEIRRCNPPPDERQKQGSVAVC
jgi:hypothetical protein